MQFTTILIAACLALLGGTVTVTVTATAQSQPGMNLPTQTPSLSVPAFHSDMSMPSPARPSMARPSMASGSSSSGGSSGPSSSPAASSSGFRTATVPSTPSSGSENSNILGNLRRPPQK
ncbi:uncharacterized protein N7482_004583 [Penicillium canariense]|uniref:Uncharacterized protein n=1 Tax=Penicillium canariense TaxID=189055 RepID=A0A9W9I6L1_9EURO|nr:uncharacterized protein N7482_004583 [Penicillium canariense]KAJ5168989.1 hypothetical protein N7482_004583 [Penicillium canariense]